MLPNALAYCIGLLAASTTSVFIVERHDAQELQAAQSLVARANTCQAELEGLHKFLSTEYVDSDGLWHQILRPMESGGGRAR